MCVCGFPRYQFSPRLCNEPCCVIRKPGERKKVKSTIEANISDVTYAHPVEVESVSAFVFLCKNTRKPLNPSPAAVRQSPLKAQDLHGVAALQELPRGQP